MASSDVDQKFLGRLATSIGSSNVLLSSALYQILGLSVLLSRKLYRARKLRKLDTSRDTKSLALYQHIIWLSREGLNLLETYVIRPTQDGQYGPECRVLVAKLRASFFHIFCLFHNQPPVSQSSIPLFPSSVSLASNQANNGRGANGTADGNSPPSRKAKQSKLRDQIPSITSEASYITNPYAAMGGPVGTPSPAPPPGLAVSPRIPQPSAFLLPLQDWLPYTTAHFNTATTLAQQCLPGSHPLRLSVALEHSAFLWDCLHDHENARRLARRAIRDVYRAQEGMDDSEFEDAAELVGVLGRMMRRRSWEGTPRVGEASTIASGSQHGGPGPPTGGASDMRSPYSSSGERIVRGNGAPIGGSLTVPGTTPGASAPFGPRGMKPNSIQSSPERPTRVPPQPSSSAAPHSPGTARRQSDSERSGRRGSESSRQSGSSRHGTERQTATMSTTPATTAPTITPRIGTSGGKHSVSRSGSTASKETTPRAEGNRGSSSSSNTPKASPQQGRSTHSPTTPRTSSKRSPTKSHNKPSQRSERR